jgi:periplasmic protein TonB
MPATAPNADLPPPSLLMEETPNARRMIGLAVVAVVHVLVGYALLSGLGRKAIELVKRPLQASVIEEVRIVPPPLAALLPMPPPQKPVPKTAPPQLAPAPAPAPAPPVAPQVPAYVPPPEVLPPPTAAPALASNSNVPPAELSALVAPTPAPAAVAPAPAPQRLEVSVACPTQVRPQMPARAIRDGTSGVVRVQLRIRGNRVQEVQILSGPKVFHDAVRQAISQYGCNASGDAEVTTVQDIRFDIE